MMSVPVVDLTGSKELIAHIFEMEVKNITEKIRKESGDEKDKLILKHEAEIEKLKQENKKIMSKFTELRNVVCRDW